MEAGAELDMRQPKGADYTPLILAAKEGYLDIVEYLLDAGANPTLANHQVRFIISAQ